MLAVSFCDFLIYLSLVGIGQPSSCSSHTLSTLLLSFFKAGVRASDVYEAARKTIEKRDENLLPHLSKTAGSIIGLEFRDTKFLLNKKSDFDLLEGMVFNVSIYLDKVPLKSGKTYSMILGDTVVVRGGGEAPLALTSNVEKELDAISLHFEEDEGDQVGAAEAARLLEQKRKRTEEDDSALKRERIKEQQREIREKRKRSGRSDDDLKVVRAN